MSNSRLSILLFGQLGEFTRCTLQQLLKHKVDVKGVILAAYGPASELEKTPFTIHRSGTPKLIEQCRDKNIPICYFTGDHDHVADFAQLHSVDLFLLACYPKHLPSSITKLATVDCLNIHPSKLPRYRGPDPIFWQLRSGECETGVTIHKVSNQFDSGDILAFRKIEFQTGARIEEINCDVAACAADLLVEQFLSPGKRLKFQPQNDELKTMQPLPCDMDYVLSRTMSSRTAYNFACAYAKTDRRIGLFFDSKFLAFRHFIDIGQNSELKENYNIGEGVVTVKFSDGFLKFAVDQRENTL